MTLYCAYNGRPLKQDWRDGVCFSFIVERVYIGTWDEGKRPLEYPEVIYFEYPDTGWPEGFLETEGEHQCEVSRADLEDLRAQVRVELHDMIASIAGDLDSIRDIFDD